MDTVSEYLFQNKNAYTCEDFTDVSELKEYLRKEEDSREERVSREKSVDFELVCDIIDTITQLRFVAEEKKKKAEAMILSNELFERKAEILAKE